MVCAVHDYQTDETVAIKKCKKIFQSHTLAKRTLRETQLLSQSTNASDYIINLNADLKISFTFLGNKLTIPWITMYDSKERVSLKKLTITFTHDEFEIITLHYKSTCKSDYA